MNEEKTPAAAVETGGDKDLERALEEFQGAQPSPRLVPFSRLALGARFQYSDRPDLGTWAKISDAREGVIARWDDQQATGWSVRQDLCSFGEDQETVVVYLDDLARGFVAGWRARPREVEVINAEDEQSGKTLALAFAVAQEAALLLDRIDAAGVSAVDLSGWSRLRAVSEAWWAAGGFTPAQLDGWLATIDGDELAPGVPLAQTFDDRAERRRVGAWSGKPAEVVQQIEDAAARIDPRPPLRIFRRGAGGAVVSDEPIPGVSQELDDDSARFYGGRYLYAETMGHGAARVLAGALGGVLAEDVLEAARGTGLALLGLPALPPAPAELFRSADGLILDRPAGDGEIESYLERHPDLLEDLREEGTFAGQHLVYRTADGGRALVHVISDDSDDQTVRFALGVIRVYEQPASGRTWEPGEELALAEARAAAAPDHFIDHPPGPAVTGSTWTLDFPDFEGEDFARRPS